MRKIEYSNGRDALAALKQEQIDGLADDLVSNESVHRQTLADPVWAGRVPLMLAAPLARSDQETFVAVSERSLSLPAGAGPFCQGHGQATGAAAAQRRPDASSARGEMRQSSPDAA